MNSGPELVEGKVVSLSNDARNFISWFVIVTCARDQHAPRLDFQFEICDLPFEIPKGLPVALTHARRRAYTPA